MPPRRPPPSPRSRPVEGELRIIGGQWRGRKLRFPAVDGLRPTPDRVRETLFNWLAPVIEGARCLDLFAGSGALGLEALSRGAASALFVEQSATAARGVRDHLATLNCTSGTVVNTEALTWLARPDDQAFDIIFLDPPFASDLAVRCSQILASGNRLKPHSWVYLEMGKTQTPPPLPDRWQLHREKSAGQVCYRLYRIDATA